MKETRAFLRPLLPLAGVAAVAAAFYAVAPSHPFTSLDLATIAVQTVILAIVASGMTLVIISGGLDLSVGSSVALAGVVVASLLNTDALSHATPLARTHIAFPAAILTGVLCGLYNAALITRLRIPPFIATLATLVGLRSFARALCESCTLGVVGTKSAQINVSDPIFKAIRDNVWIPVAVFALLAVFTWLLLTRTVLGRHIHALGGNEQAARLAGIRTENVKWFAYCFGAMTAALAGLFYVANESVAAPVNQGRGHELNAIAAAVVGGCSLTGGVGTVPGTVLGTVFLRVVIDAVSKLIKASADVYEGMIVGIIVALAVTFTQVGRRGQSGHALFSGARGLAAIPTIAIFTALLATMAAGNVAALQGRTGLFGIGVGGATLLALAVVRGLESRHAS